MRCLHPISVREWKDTSHSRLIKKSDGTYITVTCDGKKYKTNSYRLVPCGKCVACLSRRRNDWTYRLTKESSGASYSFFLTLTYDDDQIPLKIVDDRPFFVFNKKHLQDYLKRVRYYIKELDPKIQLRYFGVSEYGKKTQRPHYHMQVFIWNDDSLSHHKQICKILESNWNYGYFQRKNTSAANIHYVTKYCVKSLEQLDDRCIDPTFVICSKRPYLGACFEPTLEKQPFKNPVVFMNGYSQAMPRIYREKLGVAGCNTPESEVDPRFSAVSYRELMREYRKTHSRFSVNEFHKFLNDRLRNFENDAIRRQTSRNDKL